MNDNDKSRAVKVIVTGAASGIGRAASLRFAQDGKARGAPARLLLVDIDAEGLQAVACEARGHGAQAIVLQADLSEAQSATLVRAAAQSGLEAVDCLVSNAGYFPRDTRLADMSELEYDRMFSVNAKATWLLVKHLRPMLAETRGSVIATASISAQEPTAGIGNYSATKAALVMLIRQLAYELGPEGIRCNCVSPGTTRTGINDFLLGNDDIRTAREAWLPLRRIGQPEDLAAAIAFLASADAAYITGIDLLVDGGLNTTLMAGLAAAHTRPGALSDHA